jgi:hypothetical protein
MKVRSTTILLLCIPSLCAALGASCTVAHSSGAGSSATGAGGAGGDSISPREVFEASVQASLLTECGACHQLGGAADAPFLAAPDIYVSISSWPGVIVQTPSQSLLLTHPADPSHGGGQAPDMSGDLRPKVLAWLGVEAAHIPTPDAGSNAYIPPFKPLLKGAFNTVYLDPLGMGLMSSSISFNADEIGPPPSMLLITNLQIHPVSNVTVHLVHPLFTVYPPSGGAGPDPIDSFSTVDKTYAINDDPTIGTGSVVLTNWQKDARLGIAFEKIEAKGDGVVAAACKNVPLFQSAVVPQMQYCAMNCHGGAKAEAQAAMDLSKLNAMPPDEACAQVRARITPDSPDTSQILVVTDPTQPAVHMYKFVGNKNQYNAFKTAVTPWITSEK